MSFKIHVRHRRNTYIISDIYIYILHTCLRFPGPPTLLASLGPRPRRRSLLCEPRTTGIGSPSALPAIWRPRRWVANRNPPQNGSQKLCAAEGEQPPFFFGGGKQAPGGFLFVIFLNFLLVDLTGAPFVFFTPRSPS